MADFCLPAVVVAAAALLGRSGLSHVLHRNTLRSLLDRQALLPNPVRRIVADGLGPVELTLAVAMAAALVGAAVETVGTSVTGGATAALGAAFAGLLLALARTRPGTPCGCHGATDLDDAGIGPLDGLRAGVVVAGGLALAGGAAARLAALDAGQTATVVLAGLALAAVIDVAARIQPATSPTPRSDLRSPFGGSEIGGRNRRPADLGRGTSS